jgi:hypothetical protein
VHSNSDGFCDRLGGYTRCAETQCCITGHSFIGKRTTGRWDGFGAVPRHPASGSSRTVTSVFGLARRDWCAGQCTKTSQLFIIQLHTALPGLQNSLWDFLWIGLHSLNGCSGSSNHAGTFGVTAAIRFGGKKSASVEFSAHFHRSARIIRPVRFMASPIPLESIPPTMQQRDSLRRCFNRQGSLTKDVAPARRSAHVYVAKPWFVVERLSFIHALCPQKSRDDRGVAPHANANSRPLP